MKTRFFNLISLVCSVAVMAGCSNDDYQYPANSGTEGYIVFNFSTTDTTRAEIESRDIESAVNHLDIFIFEKDGSIASPKMHYERITGTAGRAILNKARSSFDANMRSWEWRSETSTPK